MDQDVSSAKVVGMHLASPDSGGLNCADAIGRCRRMCRGPWFWRRCRPPSCDARSIAFPLRRCVCRDKASHTALRVRKVAAAPLLPHYYFTKACTMLCPRDGTTMSRPPSDHSLRAATICVESFESYIR